MTYSHQLKSGVSKGGLAKKPAKAKNTKVYSPQIAHNLYYKTTL
jgi:hypothetical protein